MGAKVQAIKFDRTDKSSIKGRIGHSRTGACPSKGKCYHGWAHKHNKHKHK